MSTFKLQTTNPDKIEFTLTVTMTLEDWRQLREAMNEKMAVAPVQVTNHGHDHSGAKEFQPDARRLTPHNQE